MSNIKYMVWDLINNYNFTKKEENKTHHYGKKSVTGKQSVSDKLADNGIKQCQCSAYFDRFIEIRETCKVLNQNYRGKNCSVCDEK